jgi:uncharacterized repeat protein (TIGR04076 family)
MAKCKITVIKRIINNDLAEKYCRDTVGKCPCFLEGQEFITDFEKPNGFCDWAWNDILRFVTVFLAGGNFSKGIFDGWMKDEDTMIACCTDAIRPVVFKLEKID